MTRAAPYARYSSDNQREASIEDQFRLCREHCKGFVTFDRRFVKSAQTAGIETMREA